METVDTQYPRIETPEEEMFCRIINHPMALVVACASQFSNCGRGSCVESTTNVTCPEQSTEKK